jgi:enoyl-CoA hydratase
MRFSLTSASTIAEIVFDDGGMNLLSSDALRELAESVDAIPSGTRVLTFRSGRAPLFAAGADMAEMRRFSGLDAERFARLGQELFARIERLPLITVTLIDGDCFGGALDVALAFDLRFATRRSRFAHPGSRIGIVTGFGGTSRWRKAVEPAAARRLFLANDVLSCDEAVSAGLVDEAFDLFDGGEVARLATLAERDPADVRFVKELVAHANNVTDAQLMLFAERLGKLYLE